MLYLASFKHLAEQKKKKIGESRAATTKCRICTGEFEFYTRKIYSFAFKQICAHLYTLLNTHNGAALSTHTQSLTPGEQFGV